MNGENAFSDNLSLSQNNKSKYRVKRSYGMMVASSSANSGENLLREFDYPTKKYKFQSSVNCNNSNNSSGVTTSPILSMKYNTSGNSSNINTTNTNIHMHKNNTINILCDSEMHSNVNMNFNRNEESKRYFKNIII